MVAQQTPQKHRAREGKHAGEYVNCYAGIQCRVGDPEDHLTEAQFGAVKMWLKDQGTKKTSSQVTKEDVDAFFEKGDVLEYTTRWQANRDRLDDRDRAARAARRAENQRRREAGERLAADLRAHNEEARNRKPSFEEELADIRRNLDKAIERNKRPLPSPPPPPPTLARQAAPAPRSAPRIATISTPILSLNKIMTLGSSMEPIFQELRDNGCTVTYQAKENGFFSTKYYGLKISGPEGVVLRFKRWIEENS